MTENPLDKIQKAEKELFQVQSDLVQIDNFEKRLKKRRGFGKAIYDSWRVTDSWYQWRQKQLEKQQWKCASCSRKMKFSTIIRSSQGRLLLQPDHPTVDHILPKCYFPEAASDKQNLVVMCWQCNKQKGRKLKPASQFRHQKLVNDFCERYGLK